MGNRVLFLLEKDYVGLIMEWWKNLKKFHRATEMARDIKYKLSEEESKLLLEELDSIGEDLKNFPLLLSIYLTLKGLINKD